MESSKTYVPSKQKKIDSPIQKCRTLFMKTTPAPMSKVLYYYRLPPIFGSLNCLLILYIIIYIS